MLWRGDFQNGKQLLKAMGRRTLTKPSRHRRNSKKLILEKQELNPENAFHLHRQAQAQKARVLNMLLISVDKNYQIKLKRAPNLQQECEDVWGLCGIDSSDSLVSLRELLGLIGARQWRQKGVTISALGEAPRNKIYPHYGVFSPIRSEYIDLVARTSFPASMKDLQEAVIFDIGVGSGVLSAVLSMRTKARIVATDLDPRAICCANMNFIQLGISSQVSLIQTNLFPEGKANLIVCNPPWLPARPSAPIERSIYDENGVMLNGFLAGLKNHLLPNGEGWLILSDIAEHLGLRTREKFLKDIENYGLVVLEKVETKPQHSKVQDTKDNLHFARKSELTILWRLGVSKTHTIEHLFLN